MHMLESERQIRSFLSKRETMDPEALRYFIVRLVTLLRWKMLI